MKMIRRVVGISHVEDLDGIKDRAARAKCESHALALGKRLVMASNPPDGSSDGFITEAKDVFVLARSLGGGGGGS